MVTRTGTVTIQNFAGNGRFRYFCIYVVASIYARAGAGSPVSVAGARRVQSCCKLMGRIFKEVPFPFFLALV